MGDQYILSDNDDVFHDSVFVPDDSEPPEMAVFNPPIEAALDNTGYLKRVLDALSLFSRQLPALNWAAGGAVVGTKEAAAFQPAARKWIAVSPSNGNDVHSSTDFGLSWADTKATLDAIATGKVCRSVDIAPDGTAVIAQTGTVGVEVWSFNGTTWSLQTVNGVDQALEARVVYDPVRGRWCLTYLLAGGTGKAYHSTDRVTWTASATGAIGGVTQALLVNRTSGRIVWIGKLDASLHAWLYSDDGGVTWTGPASNTFSRAGTWGDGNNASIGDDGAIYVPVVDGSDTHLYRSTDDAETFVNVAVVFEAPVGRVAAIGDLVVGALNATPASGQLATGDVVYSTDRGATWKTAGVRLGTAVLHVFAGGGGLLAFGTSGASWRSARVGDPGTEIGV